MKINKLIWVILLIAVVLALSACSNASGTQTPPATRGATQTPIYIYVPVTVTPEPATITPLPTAPLAVNVTPTRTPTKAAAVVVKTATRTPTKAPVALAPAASATPSCNLGTVEPFFPEDGVGYTINVSGTSGPAFVFKWTTPLGSGPTDPNVGYRIEITSKRGGQTVNGDVVYVSHNKFIETNNYSYEGRRVRLLAAGDDVNITWQVTIIKVSGGFDNQGGKTGAEISCGTPSRIMSIGLKFTGS